MIPYPQENAMRCLRIEARKRTTNRPQGGGACFRVAWGIVVVALAFFRPAIAQSPESSQPSLIAEAPPEVQNPDADSRPLTGQVGGVMLPDDPGTVPLQQKQVEAVVDTRPSPTASPSVPASPTPFPPPYLPPLSLVDCQEALEWGVVLLTGKREAPKAMREDLSVILRWVLGYLRMMDERHSHLAQYEWSLIAEKKVTGTEMDEDRFEANLVDNVSAISLHAHRADVLVHYVGIRDDSDQMAGEYVLSPPLLLRANLPKREVFHLYFPTRVRDVIVRYAGVDRAVTPRVSVLAGRTRHREYLKQAQFYLRRALTALGKGDAEETIDLLERTSRRILKFQERYL